MPVAVFYTPNAGRGGPAEDCEMKNGGWLVAAVVALGALALIQLQMRGGQ